MSAANTILARSVAAIYPSTEELARVLESGKKLRVYHGIDPTGPDLHLGHAVPLRKLAEFQRAGHQAILLIGDFTATIGDPTDKGAVRPKLSVQEVKENMANYLNQAGKILDMSQTEVRYNSEWLSKLSLAELFNLLSQVTYAQIIKRSMFQKRLEDGKDIFLHELLYPILQGYDSVALDIDLEIGGNDQIFNMLVGRDLLKKLKGKEKFVLATKLLAAPGQVKMSKTEGNMVVLSEPPAGMYGQVMSWPDEMMPLAFELCTNLTEAEVEKILAKSPRAAKGRLAREIVTLYHGELAARVAEENFVKTFQNKEAPTDLPEILVPEGELLVDALLAGGVVRSRAEFRRLIEGGAVEEIGGGKIADPEFKITRPIRLRIGKKKFAYLRPK